MANKKNWETHIEYLIENCTVAEIVKFANMYKELYLRNPEKEYYGICADLLLKAGYRKYKKIIDEDPWRDN